MTNPTPQPTTDLLTAAPLIGSMGELLNYNGGADCPLDDEYVVERAQQALTDAATIAEHTQAIWQILSDVDNLAIGWAMYQGEYPRQEMLTLVNRWNALPPSVREFAGSGSNGL